MKGVICFWMIAAGLCRAQEPTWQFVCEGYSNWVSSIQFFTTEDRIQFVGPLDHGYANSCEAQKGGDIGFVTDF